MSLTTYTSDEVLNKVIYNNTSLTTYSLDEGLNAILDAGNDRLKVNLQGGTISGNVTVTGTLTVEGATTIIESETIQVTDKTFELAVPSSGSASDATSDGGGIILKGTTDKSILWNNANDWWVFNQGINITGNAVVSGNVGIGTTSPGQLVHIKGAVPTIFFEDSTNGDLAFIGDAQDFLTTGSSADSFGIRSQGDILLGTNGNNTRMIIASDGKVGIGETAPTAPLHIKAAPINTSGSRSAQLYIEDTTAFGSTQNSGIQFRQEWQSGSTTSTSAIVGTRTSTSSGNYGGALIFQTRANGGDLADSMIIQDNGDVGIGVTDPESRLEVKGSSIGKKLFVVHSSGTDSQCYGQEIKFDSADPDNESQYFLSCEDSAAARFRIYSSGDTWSADGGAVNSDERLKENIVDASSKLDDINKLKVRNFNWRETDSETGKTIHKGDTSSKKRIGFIAQELETVFPALVQEYDQDTEGKGEVMRKGIKHTALIPILVKAVQELSAKVEALENG